MKPLLVYDGACGFCRRWVSRWRSTLHGKAEFSPYQEVVQKFSSIPLTTFQNAVVLIEGEKHFTGAEAVFRLLALDPKRRWPLFCYQKIPGFAWIAERIYRLVARNRPFFSRITR